MYQRCNCEDFPCCGCEIGYDISPIDIRYQLDEEWYYNGDDGYYDDDY